MLSYRKAAGTDIAALTQMRVAMLCEDEAYSEEFRTLIAAQTAQFLADGLRNGSFSAWVAVDTGDTPVAMGGMSFYLFPPNDWCPSGRTAYISCMYTRPEYRRQGIAACLLAQLLAEAKERQYERLLLNATDKGRGLYEKFGFEASPTAMAHFPFGIIPVP